MLVSSGRLKRGLLCTVVALAALAVVSVASASAAITHTSITSPTNPFVYQFDANASPTPTVTIQGTSDGSSTTSDNVDINCYYGVPFGSGGLERIPVDTNVAVDSAGSFSTTVPIDFAPFSCVLRAVPAGDNFPGNYNAFPGPVVVSDHTYQQPVSGNTAPFERFQYTGIEPAGASDEYGSAGECGVFSWPMTGSEAYTEIPGWDCGAGLSSNDGSGQRSEIQIDGKNAYDTASARNAFGGADTETGFPAVTSSWSRDSSGNISIGDQESLVSCPSAAYPASSTNCGTWESDGVSLSRSTSQTDSGQLVAISDKFTSTGGGAHTLNVEYDNGVDHESPAWQLPGTSSFEAYSGGDSATLSGKSEDAIYSADGELPSGGSYDGTNALVYTTAPNSATFVNPNELLIGYTRTVPAGGSITITQYYVTSTLLTSTQKIVNGLLSQTNKPKVSITSPVPNTVTSASSVQVSGTASANDNLSLKVNGAAVPVNSDGTWSTSVSLHNGKNTITAVASDGSGNTAQATDTVYYNLKGAFCIVPNVRHMKLAKAKRALKAAGCKVGKIHKVSSKVKKGHVLHASHSAHVVLTHGTKVGLTVSKGKSHTKHNVRVQAHGVFGERRLH